MEKEEEERKKFEFNVKLKSFNDIEMHRIDTKSTKNRQQ
jgi:hypothetical protein